jgi:diguanylate cyclase (GGDEF)-like protein/PAS domain S-box-containing protein
LELRFGKGMGALRDERETTAGVKTPLFGRALPSAQPAIHSPGIHNMAPQPIRPSATENPSAPSPSADEKLLGRRPISTLFEQMPMMLTYIAADGMCLRLSRMLEDWAGVRRSSVLEVQMDKALPRLFGKENTPELLQLVKTAFTDVAGHIECTIKTKKLGARSVRISASPDYLISSRAVRGAVLVVQDLSEMRDAEIAAQRESRHMLRLHQHAIESLPVGVIIAEWDKQKDYPLVYVNPAFEQITGYSESEVMGRNCRFLQGTETRQAGRAKLRAAIAEGRRERVVIRNFRKDGTEFVNELQLSPVMDEDGRLTHVIGIQNDITKVVEAQQRLTQQANYDALTSLPNRYLFLDRLSLALKHAQMRNTAVTLIYMDLDNLKLVNDSLGHAQGDMLLKRMARRIANVIPEKENLGRLGGDEFFLFISGVMHPRRLKSLMSRLQSAVAAPMQLAGSELVLTSSIGCSRFPQDAQDAEELLRTADLAMYSAKRLGKSSWREYDVSMDSGQKKRLDMAARLRQALTNGEFSLVYQPRIDSRTGNVNSLESLIRWDNPQLGSISPATFIPLAEDIGMIGTIGIWVLEESLRQTVAWQTAGLRAVPVSVNVSPTQLRQADFVATITACLKKYNVPPHLLELELTESLFMDETVSTAPLAELREMGVRIAIDDFGTGYSALNYLTRFPVDTLKIDRIFTQPITENQKSASICRSVIELAAQLGLRTVAEGIELQTQADLLKNWGCDEMQGFLFSRPVAPDKITDLLS